MLRCIKKFFPQPLRFKYFAVCAKAEDENEDIVKHKDWFESIKDSHKFTPDNTEHILCQEIGKVFEQVLEYAGVYKRTKEGHNAFIRFVEHVNSI